MKVTTLRAAGRALIRSIPVLIALAAVRSLPAQDLRVTKIEIAPDSRPRIEYTASSNSY